MKVSHLLAAIAILCCCTGALAKPKDPCVNPRHYSNREMRDCYGREQQRANADADTLVKEIVSQLRESAQDATNGPVVNGALRDAASKLLKSQQSWTIYRDEHCHAVGSSWTTGSGAGTAYEECMFNLAQQRIKALRRDFDAYVPHTSLTPPK
jgi:uncharacterized protein YecT (DUF1311 family)